MESVAHIKKCEKGNDIDSAASLFCVRVCVVVSDALLSGLLKSARGQHFLYYGTSKRSSNTVGVNRVLALIAFLSYILGTVLYIKAAEFREVGV